MLFKKLWTKILSFMKTNHGFIIPVEYIYGNLVPKKGLAPGTGRGLLAGIGGCKSGMWLGIAYGCCPPATNGGGAHSCKAWPVIHPAPKEPIQWKTANKKFTNEMQVDLIFIKRWDKVMPSNICKYEIPPVWLEIIPITASPFKFLADSTSNILQNLIHKNQINLQAAFSVLAFKWLFHYFTVISLRI